MLAAYLPGITYHGTTLQYNSRKRSLDFVSPKLHPSTMKIRLKWFHLS